MILNHSTNLFNSELGEKLFCEATRALEDFSMKEQVLSGVLVGFSGGADSVLLLTYLCEFRKRMNADFKILAVHINHGIRGEEAERDESFSRDFASLLGVEFISVKADAPKEAEKFGLGLEEASRNIRYKAFSNIIQSRDDISCVAVAHNASDNFETVIFNMMRGAGTQGLAGISPVRDNIIRPLIYIPKSDILDLLTEQNIKYVTDSTNFSCEYTRNYIRHELIPKFKKLNSEPEKLINRMSENLRCDNLFIKLYAEKFIEENLKEGKVEASKLCELHFSPFARVISLMAERCSICGIEYVHIKKIRKLLVGGNFKFSLPTGAEFISESGIAYISYPKIPESFFKKLSVGENKISGFDDIIVVSDKKLDNSYSNVYKISIQQRLPFDIISGVLFVRTKKEGDNYRYGGMTRKLKKLFNDKQIPPSKRCDVPVFCDEKGILWVPGFGVREESSSAFVYVSILQKQSQASIDRSFYIP